MVYMYVATYHSSVDPSPRLGGKKVRLDFGLTLGCQDLDNEVSVYLTQRLSIHGADFVARISMTCMARQC